MPDYQKGKVYKIQNLKNDEIYVGSTCTPLCTRMAQHRVSSKLLKNQSKFYNTMRKLGAREFEIILLENYPCKDKDELRAKEDEYIQKLKPTLNQSY